MLDDGSLDEGRRPTTRGDWQGEQRVYAAGRIIVRFKHQAECVLVRQRRIVSLARIPK